MTDFRELCQELAEGLENAIRVIHREDGTKHISTAYPVLNKTKAALARPTDEEILRIAAKTIEPYETSGMAVGEYEAETTRAVEAYGSELIAFARAVLDRWGRSAPCPYVVSSDEGTSYCRLAEHTADLLAKLTG